ncbi:MAG: Mce-associated rane protein [Mycobacterium sp.]|jgi:Mce-associated membrane protein|nr:Mce-associated rane protein [Mycobacterium sp.]MDT5274489.1 Mce-associated rane protein [Mycobacterium sp.]MDT5305171.1 Mce-associated rane protein [Mycobacterium sp.]MDT7771062.1 Mce-associated rane protein [Mycobacterium sp.]
MAEHADASPEQVSKPGQPKLVTSEQTSSEAPEVDIEDAEDYDGAVDANVGDAPKDVANHAQRISPVRLATALGVVAVVASAAVAGWLGFREYQARQAQQQSELLIQVGRQGALNLTTIDWQHADTDVRRILDSATGAFHDDFAKRSEPFVEVLKKAQSKSVGTITEAGLESQAGDEAQVLVAVSVITSNAGEPEAEPRHWRMRISVKKVGDDAKVSNVAFIQ